MPLKILNEPLKELKKSNRISRRDEAIKKFDAYWNRQNLISKSIATKDRIKNLETVIQSLSPFNGIKVVDLGTGEGHFAKLLANQGASVTAVDISQVPLKALENHPNITIKQEYVPLTTLQDNHFDLVLALDLIGSLREDEHRLFFAEVARVVKPDGHLIISTSLDTATSEPLEKFLSLASTELILEDLHKSHHALFEKLTKSYPFKWFLESQYFLTQLEWLSEILYEDRAASHVIIKGRRKTILEMMG